MDDIFEEWNVYASKSRLRTRQYDLDELQKNSHLKIIALTGIRRSGKSSILMLLQQKISKSHKVAYINLEDSRIKNDDKVLDNILKWFSDSGYLLLDEITSVNDWEGWLARNHEMLKGELKIIACSSRKSLIIPKKPLRGRMLAYEVYPLSFKEFLEFKYLEFEVTTAGVGKIEKALEEYGIFGGFPEVVLSEGGTNKVKLLNSYFRDIIGLDVADVAKEELGIVESFGRYCVQSTYFSASKCLNYLKTLGHKMGKQSVLNLEKYSELSYLFFFIEIFSMNIKDKRQYPRKVYLGDTGFMNALTGRVDNGRLYENLVFLELKRKIGLNQEISYWKNPEGVECDFVLRQGIQVKEIIQVSYDMSNEKTKQREVRGLVACACELNVKSGIIITKKDQAEEEIKGIKVKFIPLWKWLLKAK